MPLDNAEFISELSILDPPGTDPLNQGDDHIRTTKRAVQQSFPNVDAAVPQTAAQMGQMAIKNEANTFTQVNTFNQNTIFNDVVRSGFGTALSPSYSFTAETDLGMFRESLGRLAFSAGGTRRMFIASGEMRVGVPVRGADGTAALPGYAFSADGSTGVFRNASGQLAFAHSGVQVATMASTNFDTTLNLRGPDGSAAAPAHGFVNQGNLGMYRIANDIIGISTIGIERLRIQGAFLKVNQPVQVNDGSAGAPTYAFSARPTTGLFASAGGRLNVAITGVRTAYIDASGLNVEGPQIFGVDGSAAAPTHSFASDLGTGIYRAAASTLGFSAGGVSVATMSTALFMGSGFRVLSDPMSVSAPSFSFTNDFDTGMYRSGENQLAFATAGTKKLEITSGGRLKSFHDTSAVFELNSGLVSSPASVQLKVNGVLTFEMASGTTSNRLWSLVRYNDAGGFLGLPLQVDRDTGGVIMNELPTSNPGGSGRLWNSGGDLRIT